MKSFFVLLLMMATLTATAQKRVYDNNAEERKVDNFHSIEVTNAFEVLLTQASEQSLAVSASTREDVNNIETRVDNGVLKIRYNNKRNRWGDKDLRVYIAVTDLQKLRASGACKIKVEGTLRQNTLAIELSGATDMDGDLDIKEHLSLVVSGASDIEMTGSAKDVKIDANGASDVKAYNFAAATCAVEASGASSVRITVDKELSANLSGASSVQYKGGAMIRDIKTSGASSISRKS